MTLPNCTCIWYKRVVWKNLHQHGYFTQDLYLVQKNSLEKFHLVWLFHMVPLFDTKEYLWKIFHWQDYFRWHRYSAQKSIYEKFSMTWLVWYRRVILKNFHWHDSFRNHLYLVQNCISEKLASTLLFETALVLGTK